MYIKIFLLNVLHVLSVCSCFFLFMSVGIKRPRRDRPPCLLLWCLQWRFYPVTWEGLSVPRSCLHRVDSVAGWDSTNTIVPYPNQTHRGVCLIAEPWPHSNPYRPTHACVTRQNTPMPRPRTQAWSRNNCVVDTGGWWDGRHVDPIEKPPGWVGTLSRVIKVYQEMYKNSHVLPCIAMYTLLLPCIAMYSHVMPCIAM